MGLKKYNPITPGMRQLVQIDRSDLWKGKPVKSLTEGLHRTGGRNNKGRITTRHIGGGHARRYRLIDFKRTKHDMPAIVERLEYDPNRTAFIALIKYQDGTLSYIIAPQRLKVGESVISGTKVDVKPGNAMPLKSIPVGTIIHNVEMKPGKGGQLARSAGTYVQLVGRDSGFAQIKLSSGELRRVPQDCIGSIGAVSNADHGNTQIGKAGRNRWKGIRPTVRGVAMNPIDHPHGGGEGRTSGGRHPVTPWGKGTKGTKTRNNKRTDNMIIRRLNKRRDAQGSNR
jgi:large subunit ribosomal protein L2